METKEFAFAFSGGLSSFSSSPVCGLPQRCSPRPIGNSTRSITSCAMPLALTQQKLSGFVATFSGAGAPISELAEIPDAEGGLFAEYHTLLEQATENNPAATHDGSLVVFASGAASGGPAVLSADGCFSVEAWMPYEACERLRVRVTYVDGVRNEICLVWEAAGRSEGQTPRSFLRSSPLDAMEIAGNWEAPKSERWSANGPPSTKIGLEREYSTYNSSSPILVRLPLGVSIVSPAVYAPDSTFSFGTAWSPVESARPVTIRSYDARGIIDKVDARVEIRM
jgi:hypothetical protein